MYQRLTCALVSGLVAVGCGSEEPTARSGAPDGAAAASTDEASYLFAQDVVRTYDIRVAEADLAAMDAAPAEEAYFPAELQFEGQTVSDIAVRYKGSIGAFGGCTEGTFPDTSGRKLCTKLSFKLKFNFVDPEQRFYGLKLLNLHSANSDTSFMRDRLAYRMFSEYGVPAPRAMHARVLLNGEFHGLFVAVEALDSRFTRRAFEDGDGNLYKETWPVQSPPEGALPLEERLLASLATNENSNPSVERMVAFGRDMADAADDDARRGALERWTDVEQTLRYVAVDRAILHDDGPFHWYCVGGADSPTITQFAGDKQCWNHNYYWYEEQNAARFWLVPWDMDHTFRRDHFVNLATVWNDPAPDCTRVRTLVGYAQMPPACDPLTRTLALYPAEYERALEGFLTGPFRPEAVEDLLNAWGEQIEPVVKEASDKYDDDCPGVACVVELEDWYQAFYEFKLRVAHAYQQAAAGP